MTHRQQGFPPIDLTTDDSRSRQALLITRLFDRWNLNTNDQLNLLGLSQKSRATLGRYRKGNPLSPSRDMQDRAGWLLSIHKALRLLYPHNPQLRLSWISQRNKAFNNLTPLELMKEEGLIGIAKVTRYLDFLRMI
ncbi:antitoxin Xre/MbcA/ParS toxin-binding domain-containing protein [Desulfuromonas acetoxidans]|uniref:antitoxin Xre/MbcA/ParS toxin-binding domain-containing protein n=1 Tax=Desulfuromonas acetoxidans TaxID=891 RepID=UPI00292F1D36|nr:antitoxin Xre/MbcA/ParS toxin-binding domain-containing protein [Desulfuromonas acetoxidans]